MSAVQPPRRPITFATARPRPAARSIRRAHATRKQVRRSTAVARVSSIASSPSYLVLIVLDGARPDYLTVPGLPHLRSLMQQGTEYRNAWAGILESETPSGHAAIASGSQPREDGILSFSWATDGNVPIDLFDVNKIRAGDLEHYMRQAPAPTIAQLIHRRHPRAKVVALSSFKYYAADALGGPNADVIMYYALRPNGSFGPTAVPGHVPPARVVSAPGLVLPNLHYPLGAADHTAMLLATRTFTALHQEATLINLPEFDWPLGHVDGASRDPREVRALMQGFDRDLAMLQSAYRAAGVLDKTLFVVTADHGFTSIDHKIAQSVVDDAVIAAGTRIVEDTYHTASYLWLQDKSKVVAAAAAIARKQNPFIQSVYFRSIGPGGPVYIRASGPDLFLAPNVEAANQYLLGTFNGPNGPDLAVFMRARSMMVGGGQSSWKGDHGGADWESQHVPLILSGPGIRRGYVSAYPASIIDIAPTSLTLLGVSAQSMQGIPLADAMRKPSGAMQHNQRTRERQLVPVVSALRAESSREREAHL